MKEFLPVLQQVPLFEGLTGQELSGILGCLGAKPMTVRKGMALFHEGDPADFIGIVLEGAVQVLREDYYGNRSILAHIGPQELFAESYAFAPGKTLPVSIVAAEDSRLILLDNRLLFQRLCFPQSGDLQPAPAGSQQKSGPPQKDPDHRPANHQR